MLDDSFETFDQGFELWVVVDIVEADGRIQLLLESVANPVNRYRLAIVNVMDSRAH